MAKPCLIAFHPRVSAMASLSSILVAVPAAGGLVIKGMTSLCRSC
jgi:hypothetical protein